jgi:23S rRNA pseudouridine1911/1915/1917 synthase
MPDPLADADALLTSGGKVDEEALARLVEQRRAAGEDEGPLPAVRFELQRDIQDRLDRYLTSRVPFLSRTRIQRLIESGAATVNARVAKASTRLRLNDVVELVLPPPESKEIRPQQLPLDILFEDEHLIVLNKQADIIVHPARSALDGTMINALAWHFQNTSSGALSTVGDEFARPGVVHRLDRDTTGCIAFAKDDEAHWKLAAQFEKRTVEKRYLAIVHGHYEPPIDAIDLPLGPHPSREKGYREKYVVRHDALGKASLTIARVASRFSEPASGVDRLSEPVSGRSPESGDAPGATTSRSRLRRETGSENRSTQKFSLVELELRTGRTHQIRVHLSYRGFPILGDDMYGGRPLLAPDGTPILERQALHAALLEFNHPIHGQRLRFQAPPPPDFAAALAHLRTGQVEMLDTPQRLVSI